MASQVGDVEQTLEYAFRLAAGVDGGVILLPYHYTCKVLCISLVDNPFHLIGGYGRAADRLLAHKAIGSVGCDISVYQVLYRIQIVDERIRTACGDEYPDALGLGNLKGLNRCVGIQIYAHGLEGFLQWGFNYWLSPGSRSMIDPYRITDCCGTFPAGDSFSVYPSLEGPVESARMVVFYEALQDVRLLALLEEKLGKASVEDLLADWKYRDFDTCPFEAAEFWALRERLLAALIK